ncbi:YvrJ family protein [Sporomusa sp.]|uniref:YvrJ family protein n=1 Tax=Sporomusa sp. TaxID=2078658 RepID=UPI002C20DD10|nr:YvrJ family protein [Sporomusa sp.]HWR42064.1 YvrJ family protein [Sporomusa sp.]
MDVVQIVGQVGFPIAVAAYLLVKFEAKLEAFERAATTLSTRLEVHTDRCIKCREGKPCNTATGNSERWFCMEVRELAMVVAALEAIMAVAQGSTPDHQYDILVKSRNAISFFIGMKVSS